ncbi:RNB domain-containing ribonuclease [Rhodococcus koreensis]|uniref:RNB domain-containing ribonuclease n=1 Tax=Rhodococcus koreensis TaxID=99653 RepID=UPI0036D8D9C7
MAVDPGSVAKHGHYGLRLSAYTHVTSPLRRVADLINQRIVFAHLDHSPAPHTGEQLAALGADLNRRTREAREAKKNRYKHADQRIVTQEATRDLTALDARTFHKVLKSAAAGPLRDEIATELGRRLETDALTASDVAQLVGIADPTWRPIQLRIVDTLSTTHPEMGPSVASIWRQAHPDQPEPTVDHRAHGADHNRTFAARATHLGIRGPWMNATTKKHAEQAALWSAVQAQLTDTDNNQPEPEWPLPPQTPEPEPRPDPTPAAPTAAKAATLVPLATIADLSETKRRKAQSNPVAWLMSLAQNEQLPKPEWDFTSAGPSHAPRFTATAHFAGRTGAAVAGSKSAAKIAAATTLVEALTAEG